MFFKASPERTVLLSKVIEYLRSVPVGSAFDYGDLRLKTGLEMDKNGGRSLLYRAFHKLNEEVGANFANIPGSGYERLVNGDIHKVGAHARLRIRNTAKRSKRRIENAVARINDIKPEDAHKIGVECAVLGLIGRAAEDRTLTMVEKTVVPGDGVPEVPTMRNFADFIARNS